MVRGAFYGGHQQSGNKAVQLGPNCRRRLHNFRAALWIVVDTDTFLYLFRYYTFPLLSGSFS